MFEREGSGVVPSSPPPKMHKVSSLHVRGKPPHCERQSALDKSPRGGDSDVTIE